MRLSMNQQRWLKAFHLIFAAVWLSSIVTMTALTVLVNGVDNDGGFHMVTVAYHFIDFKLLTPAAIGTFLTGLVYSLYTPWGFFKHGWITYKWIVTLGLILVGTFYLGPMTTEITEIASREGLRSLGSPEFLSRWRTGLCAGFINGALLTGAVFASTLKPFKKKQK